MLNWNVEKSKPGEKLNVESAQWKYCRHRVRLILFPCGVVSNVLISRRPRLVNRLAMAVFFKSIALHSIPLTF